MTFEDAARKVHLEQSRTFRNPKHRAQWIASLEADVFPTIGKRRIDAIASSDVLSVLSPVWTAKPETARRLKQRMRVVFDWAKASGLRAGDNPTEGLVKVLPKHRATAKHHPAMPYERVSEFVSDVQNFDGSELLKLGFAFFDPYGRANRRDSQSDVERSRPSEESLDHSRGPHESTARTSCPPFSPRGGYS